jgi:sugar lactone lactonase YvrE
MSSTNVELVLPLGAELGEGPVWDSRRKVLLFVDILASLIYEYDPSSETVSRIAAPGQVGSLAPRSTGGLVAAFEHSFAVVDPGGSDWKIVATVEPDAPTRMNDGNCDRVGRFYAGTMAYDETTPAGALYRLDPDGSVERLVSNVACSNGIDWSTNWEAMYYIDSATRSLDAFDFDIDAGRVSERRPIVRFTESEGLPDGLVVDADGGIWVALWGGSALRQYTADGELEMVIELPTSNVTSAGFGGDDLEDLYITSAREGLSTSELADQPLAGGVFRCRPGVEGRRQHVFSG